MNERMPRPEDVDEMWIQCLRDTANPPQGPPGPPALPRQAPKWPLLDIGMSNCDMTIDDDLGATLRSSQVLGHHFGWNFHGVLWFADGRFHEEVSVYHKEVGVYSAETLEELMRLVNDEFGWD